MMAVGQVHDVALIDDDAAVLDSLRFMLEAAGIGVATYPSAATYLQSDLGPPRCLIVDQHMPQMTGLELAARLRSVGSAVPIVLITASPSAAIIAQATALSVALVLDKPPPEDALLRFVAGNRAH